MQLQQVLKVKEEAKESQGRKDVMEERLNWPLLVLKMEVTQQPKNG